MEPQKRVLSVRCDTGNLLAAVRPSDGIGIDICPEIVEIAQQRNPSLNFAVAFPDKEEFRQAFRPGEKFDYILFNEPTCELLFRLIRLSRLVNCTHRVPSSVIANLLVQLPEAG